MSHRTLVAHATSLLTRGFLSTASDRVSARGEPTNALYALTRALRVALAFKEPQVAVAVIDAGVDSMAWAPLLRAQNERLPDLLRAHGLHVVTGVDPGDLVASYTHAALDAGHDVVVVGSDKRLAQLVSDRVWWYDAYKDVRYTPELVRKRFEVEPPHVAGWLALVGDDDALPGVKGIGKKGATGLIERHGSVAEALANSDEVGGRTGKALRAALESVATELDRAHFDRTTPLPVPFEQLGYEAPAMADVQELYAELGFLELLTVLDDADAAPVLVCDTAELLSVALAGLDERPAALHAVTEDPSPVRGSLVGIAIAQGGSAPFYVPLAQLAQLAPFLEDASRPKAGHDVKECVVACARHGVSVAGIVADSACASHLHEPSNMAPHDLSIVAKHVLRRALPEEEAVRGVGRKRKAWGAVPADRVASYAGKMAEAAAAAWEALEPTTDRALLDEYLTLSETLVRMELRGIACVGADLARSGEDFTRIGDEIEAQIFELVGKSFNLGSTKQLGSVLFEDLGLTVFKKTKTGWSTATAALERIEHDHPVVPLVIRWRRLRRLRDTWVTALLTAIDDDGRVRSTFNPARSFSGRLVNSAPDLGRVPGATPEMKRIRRAFRAPEGRVLLSVDYSQLGLYVLAHLSEDPALVDPLRREQDMHTLTASAVLQLPVDAIGADERQVGKVVNFATFAGQGASALAQQLGVSASEAKRIIARFDERYAVVRAFQEEQLDLVRSRGFIETIAGRRWPIRGLSSLDQMARSYAERLSRRATHEGSVADVSRRGLLRADQALRSAGLTAFPLLQVHDEVLFEVPLGELPEASRIAADAMRGAFELRVPLRVGCKAGPSWAELSPLA